MSILFANKHFLPLALLVLLLPLLLHLFSRMRPPKYLFSSVEFLREIIRKNRRIKRPQNWLLLILRTLLCAALVLMFLKPRLFLNEGFAGGPERRTAVIIVDATASMGYIEGGRTRFAAACAEASEILSGLSPGSRANIIWLRSPCRAVFKEPGINLDYLRDELRRAAVSYEHGSVREALGMASDMLSEEKGAGEVYIISDFQKSTWKEAALSVPQGIRLLTVRVGKTAAENTAVTALRAEPPFPLKNEAVTVHAEITNFSPAPRTMKAYISAAHFRQSKEIYIQPRSRASLMFSCRFDEAGAVPVTVQTDEDGFPADNKRHLILDVQTFLKAGIYAGEKETAQVWRRALSALGRFRPETLSDADFDRLSSFGLVMIAGWQGDHAEALQAYLEQGGILFVYPGPALLPSALMRLTDAPGPVDGEDPLAWQQFRETKGLKINSPQDPVFTIFGGGEYGNPASAVFSGRFTIPEAAASGGEVLLAFEDGVPGLIRYSSPGTFFLWNLPLQKLFGNMAAQVEYLPLLAELIAAARTAGRSNGRAASRPGEPLSHLLPHGLTADGITLADEKGTPLALSKQFSGNGTRLVSSPVEKTGIYTWKRLDETIYSSAVNFPLSESDPETLDDAEIRKAEIDTVKSGYQVRKLHEGIDMWPYLAALGMGFILLECLLVYWFRRQ